MAPRKRIVFIHHGRGLGGAPLSLLYLIQGLDKERFEPVVVFLHDSEALKLFKAHNLTVVGPTNTYDFPHTKIWWLSWRQLPLLARVISDSIKTIIVTAPALYTSLKPDILHLNTSSLIAWAAAAHVKKIPVVWHIREPLADGYMGLRKRLVRWCVRTFSTVIVPISHHDAQPWNRLPKTHVVYNAVPTHRFDFSITPARIDHGSQQRILFLGGCSREKGTLQLLITFQELVKRLPQAHLVIAGALPAAGGWRVSPGSQFAAQVHRYLQRLAPNITLAGVTYDIPALMASCQVVVFPATVGHFARPIIEAGFMKKPVIASQLPPLNELVHNGVSGFLVDPYDSEAWAAKLYTLLTDHALQQTMGEAGYAWCSQQFGMEKHVHQIATLYDAILERDV